MFNKVSRVSKGLGHDLRLVLVSVLVSSVVVGVPATAAVYVANADKVDNKHAVASGATVQARKGKLVATNRRTGRLPNNIIAKAPNANKLDGVDSSGFLRRAGKAADAEKLDGVDSADFLRGVKMRTGTAFTAYRNGLSWGEANCLDGEYATGGGVYPLDEVRKTVNVIASYPLPNALDLYTPKNNVIPTGWRVLVSNNDLDGSAAWSVLMTPYVLCISATP